MTDLAILVPSRGRPANVARLIEACAKTCRVNYLLHFGFDDDDPKRAENVDALAPDKLPACIDYHTWPRMGLAAWTNKLASYHLDVPYLASVGDDMVPETDGWDERLITAVEHMGGGFAHANTWRYRLNAEACVMSSRIAAALGWMALPRLHHWYIDTVWADLGHPDRLAYLPDVSVRHHHPNMAGHPGDRTYWDAATHFQRDMAAWQKWRLLDMRRDRETVRRACSRA